MSSTAVRSKAKTTQLYTPRATLFPKAFCKGKKKKELPWVGFEPTTLCTLGERCTMHVI